MSSRLGQNWAENHTQAPLFPPRSASKSRNLQQVPAELRFVWTAGAQHSAFTVCRPTLTLFRNWSAGKPQHHHHHRPPDPHPTSFSPPPPCPSSWVELCQDVEEGMKGVVTIQMFRQEGRRKTIRDVPAVSNCFHEPRDAIKN